jgi:hypothetical protein
MSFTKASSATGNATTAGAHLLAALALNAVGRRWATRALALEEADERKAQYLREGGILRAQSSPRFHSSIYGQFQFALAAKPRSDDEARHV